MVGVIAYKNPDGHTHGNVMGITGKFFYTLKKLTDIVLL